MGPGGLSGSRGAPGWVRLRLTLCWPCASEDFFSFFPRLSDPPSSLILYHRPLPLRSPYIHTAIELEKFRGLEPEYDYTKGEMQTAIHSFDKYLLGPYFVSDQLRHVLSVPGEGFEWALSRPGGVGGVWMGACTVKQCFFLGCLIYLHKNTVKQILLSKCTILVML